MEPRPHQSPPEHDAERLILDEVLRWALPIAYTLGTLTLVTALLTGMYQALWTRGGTSAVLLAFTTVATWERRRSRPRRAVAWIIAGVGVVISMALTFAGGLRSPSAMLLLYLIALCGWVYGRRAATVMAAVAAGVVALYFGLGRAGLLPESPTLPLFGLMVMFWTVIALVWSTSALPAERMRQALEAAEARQRELAAEQARRLEAARQFQAVFDQTSHLMGLVSPDGVLRKVNRAVLRFVGGEHPEAVVGQRFAEGPWWEPSRRAWAEAQVARVVATGQPLLAETIHLDAQGRPRTVDFSLTPFHDETGQLRYLIAEGRDVTEMVERKERASSTRRMELVGQLAGGVAHDFNNVLMVILSSVESLKVDLQGSGIRSALVEEELQAIAAAGQRASDLTRRLLSFARRGPVDRRPLSVHALLESTARLLERTLPANVKVSCEPAAEEDVVEGDASALESALLNLALNARDAMPEGGTLAFRTERLALDPERCRALGLELPPGPYLRLSVRDTGTGIAPEHQGRVFEPFFTTKDEGKGSGLGLASVYGVVREHGGAVTLESALGRGSVFHLYLPVSRAAALPAPAGPVGGGFGGLRALVVDDEPRLRTTVPRLLKRLDIDSEAVGSAEEALERFDPGFDLVISDVVLPGRRGDQLAVDLLARKASLKVLLVSGYPRDLDPTALPPDRVRLLGKPFTLDELRGALRELLGPAGT